MPLSQNHEKAGGASFQPVRRTGKMPVPPKTFPNRAGQDLGAPPIPNIFPKPIASLGVLWLFL
jgi:hypothetical protein